MEIGDVCQVKYSGTEDEFTIYKVSTDPNTGELQYYGLLVINEFVSSRLRFKPEHLTLVRKADAASMRVLEENPPEVDEETGEEFGVEIWVPRVVPLNQKCEFTASNWRPTTYEQSNGRLKRPPFLIQSTDEGKS